MSWKRAVEGLIIEKMAANWVKDTSMGSPSRQLSDGRSCVFYSHHSTKNYALLSLLLQIDKTCHFKSISCSKMGISETNVGFQTITLPNRYMVAIRYDFDQVVTTACTLEVIGSLIVLGITPITIFNVAAWNKVIYKSNYPSYNQITKWTASSLSNRI